MSFALKTKCFGLAAAVLSSSLAACSSGEKVPPGSPFAVSVPRAEFFKYGPAQSFGADFVLPKGQRLIMLSRQFGFSKVMTEDGITGWVSTEDVSPAPPDPRRLIASNSRRRGAPDRMYSGPRKSSNVQTVPGDPLFDMSDLPPPPLPENPDKPKPKFRVAPPKTN